MPCREMFPHERALVKRLQGKPFALIGINSDFDKDFIRKRMQAENITWRSFWNGPLGTSGPISAKWGVTSWPTIFVLDHKGIIRSIGAADLDKVVDQLLGEMKSKPGK